MRQRNYCVLKIAFQRRPTPRLVRFKPEILIVPFLLQIMVLFPAVVWDEDHIRQNKTRQRWTFRLWLAWSSIGEIVRCCLPQLSMQRWTVTQKGRTNRICLVGRFHAFHRPRRPLGRVDLGTRRGWGVSFTPRPLSTPGKHPIPIVQEAGWAPGPVWTGA
jgi:hypothetical protein